MSELTVLQVTPPGLLAWHGPLVAGAPALLAWASAAVAYIAPRGRWPIVIGGTAAAWLVLALALLPDGAAASYQPGFSALSLQPAAVLAALGLSLLAAWWTRRSQPALWAWWCGCGLGLPLVLFAVAEHLVR